MNNLLRRFGFRQEASSTSSDNNAKPAFNEDFFAFKQFGACGFPNKPNCLALDEELGLLAIGTRSGFVHIFGQPGIHLQGEHETHSSVIHIAFLKGKSKFLTVCEDGAFVVWSLKPFEVDNSPKDGGASTNPDASDSLLIRGETKRLDQLHEYVVTSCCLDDRMISQDDLLRNKVTNNVSNASRDLPNEVKAGQTNVPDVRLYVGMMDGNTLMLKVTENHVDVSDISEKNANNIFMSHDEVILEHFSEEEVKFLGSVVSIAPHPLLPQKVLVGYSAGFSVLWDISTLKSDCVFSAFQQLESVSYNHDGTEFVSSHADGSYIIWNSLDCSEAREPASTPYGPYQCEAINKFVWKTNESSSLMIFSGGMPRSGYGDRWTVTIMRGDGDDGEQSHVVLDLTSRVIDFVVVDSVDSMSDDEEDDIDNGRENNQSGEAQADKPTDRRKHHISNPHSLVVLAEEEMVVIDLVGRDWPSYWLPHLMSPHCSAITSVFHVSKVSETFLKKLVDAGKLQQLRNVSFTRRTWPFLGGQSLFSKDTDRDLLLTGHEDGSVRFWQTKKGDIQLLYRLDTAQLFGIEISGHSETNNDSDEDWPPFKKVGAYNPFTDDPRLAVRQMILCTSRDPETLLLAGTAGQIIVCEFKMEEKNNEKKFNKKDHKEEKAKKSRPTDERLVDTGASSSSRDAAKNSLVSVTVHRPFADPKPEGSQEERRETTTTTSGLSAQNLSGDAVSESHVVDNLSNQQVVVGVNENQEQNVTSVTNESPAVGSDQPSSSADIVPGTLETESALNRNSIGFELRNSQTSQQAQARESYSSSLSSSLQFEVKVSSVNLVGDRDDFVWMGHTPLEVVNGGDKNRSSGGKASAPILTPSSVFLPYPLSSSISCSAFSDASPGFQASCVVLIHPPVSCTSLALQSHWQLIAFGSEYGYGLYDYNLGKLVFSKSSKSDNKGTNAGSAFGARARLSDMFRRTLRASFRKLERARSEFRERRRRSQQTIWKSFSASRCPTYGTTHCSSDARASVLNTSTHRESKGDASALPDKPSSSSLNYPEPHRRNTYQDAAGSSDLFKGNSLDRDPQTASLSRAGTPIVRCLYFAEDAFHSSSNATCNPAKSNQTPGSEQAMFGTFWVGTSLGTIYMYNITISPSDKRNLQPVVYTLAKEIHLKHEAPILDICMLNRTGSPLGSDDAQYPLPVISRNRRWRFPPAMFGSLMSQSSSGGQCLVVCSQKQVKVFSYPGLKARRKVKIEKAGGSGTTNSDEKCPTCTSSPAAVNVQNVGPQKNIAKVAYSCFENRTDESIIESGLVCLTDDGGACVYSLPSLKLRFSTSALSKEFMSDIKLCVLTSHGYGFWLCSPSEFGRFSMSSNCPKICSLSLTPSHPLRSKNQKKKDSDGTIKNTPGEENAKRTPNSGSVTASTDPHIASLTAEKTHAENLTSIQTPGRSGSRSPGISVCSSSRGSGKLEMADEADSKNASLRFNKITDISYIKDEQMIEKIINKFVQMDVPECSMEWRREIQFSIPLQQHSLDQQSHQLQPSQPPHPDQPELNGQQAEHSSLKGIDSFDSKSEDCATFGGDSSLSDDKSLHLLPLQQSGRK